MATTYLDLDHTEGYWRIDDDELYYRRFGTGDTVLLGLHGGPGMPHEYLLPLAEHASDRVSVYLYDQFGVGKSDTPAPGDFDRYTVAHYREELEAVRQQIDPDRLILYGQSWGGMLAQEYMLAYGQHVDGVVLANTLADSQTAFESMRSVLDELPEDKQELIAIAEAARDFDDPAYLAALDMAYRQHVCRCDPYPDPVEYAFEHTAMDVYGLMWGPNEYVLHDQARLREWDIRDRLSEITTPTLVVTGEYDEIDPAIARDIAGRIPNAELVEFADASHMPFWERPDAHATAIDKFLAEHI